MNCEDEQVLNDDGKPMSDKPNKAWSLMSQQQFEYLMTQNWHDTTQTHLLPGLLECTKTKTKQRIKGKE